MILLPTKIQRHRGILLVISVSILLIGLVLLLIPGRSTSDAVVEEYVQLKPCTILHMLWRKPSIRTQTFTGNISTTRTISLISSSLALTKRSQERRTRSVNKNAMELLHSRDYTE
ncbi:unnamed protein product [Brassica oleracea]